MANSCIQDELRRLKRKRVLAYLSGDWMKEKALTEQIKQLQEELES